MATTEPSPTPGLARPAPQGAFASQGSQSRFSPVLLWIFVAALLFRIVTSVTDRASEAKTLVRWEPLSVPAATASDRPVLYDFTAAWCPPCKILDREGWNNPEIAGVVNRSFRPVRIVDRQREDGRNTPAIAALQKRHGVRAFPTLVVAGADGKEISRFEGYRGRAALVKFLQESAAAARGAPPTAAR